MKLRSLKRCDHSRAVDFAVRGMHFDWYMNSRFLKQLYGRYFLCLSLCRASQVIAAYEGERLAGVLIADFNDKKRLWSTPLKRGFVHLFCLLQGIYASGTDVYDNVNREMYTEFLKGHSPRVKSFFSLSARNLWARALERGCFVNCQGAAKESLFTCTLTMPAIMDFTNTWALKDRGKRI